MLANVAVTNGDTKNLSRDSFAQLLNECLDTDADGEPALGTDVVTNHRLICVILKTGIDAKTSGQVDPFASHASKSQNLLRCLDVIELVVDGAPDVLFQETLQNDHGQADEIVPLFAWLLPKLMLLKNPYENDDNDRQLQTKLTDLLTKPFLRRVKSTRTKGQIITLLQFTILCLKGVSSCHETGLSVSAD